ncbi:MAG: formate dehydrogenase accessory sulfurtransferase FdhD [Mycobacteriales bacterium]|nr:MAG: formate dehydrogenase accessory sulfurtransferase FdhD [Pseudonocardiales bacterium]
MTRKTQRRKLIRITDGVRTAAWDTLVAEEPLEIRLAGRALAVTMRTPGDDFDLAAGFLASEGVIASDAELAAIRYCSGTNDAGENTYNVLDVDLAPGVDVPQMSLQRNVFTSSSCGVCGKASLESVRTASRFTVGDDPISVEPDLIAALPDRLRAAQGVFETTGGLHAAGLFDSAGGLVSIREDVGRHNAVDKLVGAAVREGRLPLAGHILLVSGRASFELVQKAAMAAIPVMAAVSAPSSLAVELAEDAGITLIGFLRGDSMNVYSGAHRLATPDTDGEEAPRRAPATLR